MAASCTTAAARDEFIVRAVIFVESLRGELSLVEGCHLPITQIAGVTRFVIIVIFRIVFVVRLLDRYPNNCVHCRIAGDVACPHDQPMVVHSIGPP